MGDAYDEIDAWVVRAPEDVVIDDDEVSRDGVSVVEHVLVHALLVVDRHRESRDMTKTTGEIEEEENKP